MPLSPAAAPASATLGPFVGILGGMGPLGTVDLMEKIVRFAHAAIDQDHVPVIAHNVPQIPDRQRFLHGAGPSPVPVLKAGLDRLNAMGAGLIMIPCNTAHFWFDELSAHSRAPILHITDAAIAMMAGQGLQSARVGLIATPATVAAGFYQARLAAHGYECLTNTPDELAEWFTPGCDAVKGGRIVEGGRYFAQAAAALEARGATHWLLGCTEVPMGLAAIDFARERTIDATEALARGAIAWWREQNPLNAEQARASTAARAAA